MSLPLSDLASNPEEAFAVGDPGGDLFKSGFDFARGAAVGGLLQTILRLFWGLEDVSGDDLLTAVPPPGGEGCAGTAEVLAVFLPHFIACACSSMLRMSRDCFSVMGASDLGGRVAGDPADLRVSSAVAEFVAERLQPIRQLNAGFLLNGSATLSLPGLYSQVKSNPRSLSYQRACRGDNCFCSANQVLGW